MKNNQDAQTTQLNFLYSVVSLSTRCIGTCVVSFLQTSDNLGMVQ